MMALRIRAAQVEQEASERQAMTFAMRAQTEAEDYRVRYALNERESEFRCSLESLRHEQMAHDQERKKSAALIVEVERLRAAQSASQSRKSSRMTSPRGGDAGLKLIKGPRTSVFSIASGSEADLTESTSTRKTTGVNVAQTKAVQSSVRKKRSMQQVADVAVNAVMNAMGAGDRLGRHSV